MIQIIVFPTGTLSASDREAITSKGALAIEADDPSKIVELGLAPMIRPEATLLCALEAMQGVTSASIQVRANFVTSLYETLKKEAASENIRH